MRIIDLSQTIENNMPVYPGDQETILRQVKNLDEDHYTNYQLETGMHAGTHVDSPMHLSHTDKSIAEAPLESLIGAGCLIDARGQQNIGMQAEYERLVAENSIVLIYTGWDKQYGSEDYYENAPCVSTELCEFLIEKKIKMLGIDLASPDRFPFPVHKALFESGAYVLENLTNLGKLLGVKAFEIVALPLKIQADSSPVRAVAVVR